MSKPVICIGAAFIDELFHMQEEMIAEIERSEPKLIVYCNIEASWLYHPGAPRLIYEWADQYTTQHYEIVGVVDEANLFESVYKWNSEAKNYQPGGQDYIKIYKRK